ncbi:hypothetical protein LXL04_040145 [Taraxacum kok-saghyz]
MLFRFRDSYNLLPSSLSELAKSLCPDLGGKGSVDHKSVKIENIGKNKDALLGLIMRQDVYLLGGCDAKSTRHLLESDLYYYDVNSLYPFVMKEYPMPAGHPVWYSRLDNRDLEGKLGFIEAYVRDRLHCDSSLRLSLEKKESPFSEFVSAIFSSRLEAKKSGNDALSYVYKILMNSLYGRFGINPMGTITEVCDNERRPHLMRKTDFDINL